MTDWPSDMPVAQVRVARPTADLAAIIRFYGEGLGLKQIASFHGHAGYDGVMFGLPGREYHLEFTAAEAVGAGSQGPGARAEAAEVGGRESEAGEKTENAAAHGRTPTVREWAKAETAGASGPGDGEEVSTTCGWVSAASRFAPPSQDNLLVLYLPDRTAVDRIAARLASMGYPAVEPENPYWAERGITIGDPDGWRIVLMNTAGI